MVTLASRGTDTAALRCWSSSLDSNSSSYITVAAGFFRRRFGGGLRRRLTTTKSSSLLDDVSMASSYTTRCRLGFLVRLGAGRSGAGAGRSGAGAGACAGADAGAGAGAACFSFFVRIFSSRFCLARSKEAIWAALLWRFGFGAGSAVAGGLVATWPSVSLSELSKRQVRSSAESPMRFCVYHTQENRSSIEAIQENVVYL
jgi:hypothetical protein